MARSVFLGCRSLRPSIPGFGSDTGVVSAPATLLIVTDCHCVCLDIDLTMSVHSRVTKSLDVEFYETLLMSNVHRFHQF
ncbi:hypothetical protein GJ496_009005 [Pomphorhynchus laevis]|nr:hypothetical protein GJ496_009005 [Pomphorhynchus laevis]